MMHLNTIITSPRARCRYSTLVEQPVPGNRPTVGLRSEAMLLERVILPRTGQDRQHSRSGFGEPHVVPCRDHGFRLFLGESNSVRGGLRRVSKLLLDLGDGKGGHVQIAVRIDEAFVVLHLRQPAKSSPARTLRPHIEHECGADLTPITIVHEAHGAVAVCLDAMGRQCITCTTIADEFLP